MTPKAIAATDNWFYVREFANGIEAEIRHVAAWGLDIHGNVSGLVADDATGPGGVPVLQAVGKGGKFVHRDQLNDKQKSALLEQRSVYRLT
ncbi:hypothetical protein [Xanthomonas axonopodis]|uniref:hypothetical protein n=1 Tax=Xanthomonas axonopodis TaxID=53413 RepID=UPI0035581B16